jgi:NAD(P)-dependent dehydrogenase (short-subunit alcohol dehydrogenase family)
VTDVAGAPDVPPVAVVTGAAGGIGAAITRKLCATGYRVVAAGRSAENLAVVRAKLGPQVQPVRCDVTDEAQVARLAARVGAIDVLVNNAGDAAAAPIEKETLDGWRRMLEVNATSAFLVTRAFLPGMLAAGRGRVVFVASASALYGEKFIGSYTAAKHAVLGLARTVAAEVAGTGVTSNSVCPSYVRTPMTERSVRDLAQRSQLTEAEAARRLFGKSTLGRLIEPAEVAAAVAYFASAEAAAVNGQSLVIDGGRLQY